jgi:hypothetical protein
MGKSHLHLRDELAPNVPEGKDLICFILRERENERERDIYIYIHICQKMDIKSPTSHEENSIPFLAGLASG